MRLSPDEIDNLIMATGEFIKQNFAELRLYGSRTDITGKGGDIDLLLIVDDYNFLRELNLQKHLLLSRMKELIGEQKIDLKIIHKNEIAQDPFLQIVFPQSKILKSWPGSLR